LIPVGTSARIYLFTQPTDMRKAFDGLSGEVRRLTDADPMSGSLFVFANRRRDLLKILCWDRHGFWLFCKRLEAGRFQIPECPVEQGGAAWQVAYEQLLMILEGIDLGARRRKRFSQETQGISPPK
jgi:transposase